MRDAPRPFRILEWMAAQAVPQGLSGDGALGDLAEGFQDRATKSRLMAHLWYARQVLSLLSYAMLRGPRGEGGSSDLVLDLRWSIRSLVRHPTFALGVIAVLGLGLGANVAVFSVVDGTLGRASWWSEPARTLEIWPDQGFSMGQLDLYSEMQTAYRSVGGYAEFALSVQTGQGESESVNSVAITPELFRELTHQPMLGRALADDDAFFAGEQVAVIGEALWRRSFGADPEILGRRIEVAGTPVTVVGVQPLEANAPGGRTEIWLALSMDPRDEDFWKAQDKTMVGVWQTGAVLDDAQQDLVALTDRLSDLFPMFFPSGFADGLARVARADEAQRRTVSAPLLLLLGGTSLLLLVTALNVGNLLLGRANGRRKELAVRSALGAGRGRIVGQLLVEGTIFTALALAVALGSGAWGGEWVARLFVGEAMVGRSSIGSGRVLAFTGVASLVAWGILNGIPVAYFLTGQRRGLELRPGTGTRMRRLLVGVQASLATLLLVSASLLVTTVDNIRSVPLGFDPEGLLTVELSPPADRVASPAVARDLYGRLSDRIAAVPGVEAVGMTGWLPLRAQAPAMPLNLESAPVDPAQAIRSPLHSVDPGFFRALGVEASGGRLLGTEDRDAAASAVVVNETLAELLWPDGSAVGQRIAIDPHAWDRWVPVVGVVPDIRSGVITGPPEPAVYVSLAELPTRDLTVVVRGSRSMPALSAEVRRAVQEVDALVPVRAIGGMDGVVRQAYATAWVMMGLLIVLAVMASVLGAIGIYAVLTHHVSLNRRELGVRIALGARPREVVRRIVGTGVGVAGLGVVVGGVMAVAATRLLESLLFEVSALDPWAFVTPALVLVTAAAVAAWVPATRAGRLPPAEVLRAE